MNLVGFFSFSFPFMLRTFQYSKLKNSYLQVYRLPINILQCTYTWFKSIKDTFSAVIFAENLLYTKFPNSYIREHSLWAFLL